MEIEHRQQRPVWNKPGGSGGNQPASLELIADSRKLTAPRLHGGRTSATGLGLEQARQQQRQRQPQANS